MPHIPGPWSGALLAGLSLLAASAAPPPVPQSPPQDPAAGHLVLVVEGTVNKLTITRAVAKPDAWAGVPKGLASRFALRILDAQGSVLHTVPLDLSAFDTDPAHIGRKLTVQGCLVRDWRIGMLVSVPQDPRASRFVFVRDGVEIGAHGLGELLRLGGERR
jgi:hypothetical protein